MTARLERISRMLAARRAQAREATPEPGADAGDDGFVFDPARKKQYLFVQSFRSGAIAPIEGATGTYSLTLREGLGQTIAFADRPARDVEVMPTSAFLDGLGFSPDNPPNAALVIETGAGETDIAVVELRTPTYETIGRTATYEVTVLDGWRETTGFGAGEVAEPAALPPDFGAAHLFIDDCSDGVVTCRARGDVYAGTVSGVIGFCWNYSQCMPCEPYYHTQPSFGATVLYWAEKCKRLVPACAEENSCGVRYVDVTQVPANESPRIG